MKKVFGFFCVGVLFVAAWSLKPNQLDVTVYQDIDANIEKYKAHFKQTKYAIVVDYSKPIFMRRLWVIDIQKKEVLLNAHVSHAKNSGFICANEFSNEIGSEYSSKGVFLTLNAYESSFGKGIYKLGMRLKGLEDCNDNVFERNIVLHPSYAPWSSGCFMTLPKTNKKIIDQTKNGSILLVYPLTNEQ